MLEGSEGIGHGDVSHVGRDLVLLAQNLEIPPRHRVEVHFHPQKLRPRFGVETTERGREIGEDRREREGFERSENRFAFVKTRRFGQSAKSRMVKRVFVVVEGEGDVGNPRGKI